MTIQSLLTTMVDATDANSAKVPKITITIQAIGIPQLFPVYMGAKFHLLEGSYLLLWSNLHPPVALDNEMLTPRTGHTRRRQSFGRSMLCEPLLIKDFFVTKDFASIWCRFVEQESDTSPALVLIDPAPNSRAAEHDRWWQRQSVNGRPFQWSRWQLNHE